jgi:hypothetical protein
MKLIRIFILSLIIICFYSCKTFKLKGNYVKTELFFGLSDGSIEITEEQWLEFKTNFLNKTFSGYTETSCKGFWTSDDNITLEEKCKMIIYLNSGSKKDSIDIFNIIKNYKMIFKQESVLKVETLVNASF